MVSTAARAGEGVQSRADFELLGHPPALAGDPERMAEGRGHGVRAHANFHSRRRRPHGHAKDGLVGQLAGLDVLGQHAVADLDRLDRLPAAERPDLCSRGETGGRVDDHHRAALVFTESLAVVFRLVGRTPNRLAGPPADVVRIVIPAPPRPPSHGIVTQLEPGGLLEYSLDAGIPLRDGGIGTIDGGVQRGCVLDGLELGFLAR